LIFGDMTGKGVTAAALTALMRHGARVACRSDPAPSAILASLDKVLAQQAGDAMLHRAMPLSLGRYWAHSRIRSGERRPSPWIPTSSSCCTRTA